MKIKLSFLLAIAALLFQTTPALKAQTSSSDLWMSSTFKYELLKDLDLKVEIGHRRENQYSQRLYGDLVLKYKFSDYVKIGVAWRHAGEPDPFDADFISDRFNIDLSGDLEREKISLDYRVRYQTKFENWWTNEEGQLPNESARTRLLLGYKMSKDWFFEAGIESFFKLTNEEPTYVDKLRYIAGVEYRINKSQDIALHLIRQQDVQVANPHTSNILSIDYSVDVERVVKKIKKRQKKKRKKEAANS